ncbi:MAG: thiolase family protein [Desulfomonilaceae bacterium]|nr:thiolase family protein [Desulfomonilaceae bacterium]
MKKDDIVITKALRTPVGSFGGVFRDLKATELTVPLMRALTAEIDAGIIDDVIWGVAYQRTRDETNHARVAAVLAGIPHSVPGVTIQRVCVSSMWCVAAGIQAIRAGDAEVILAGGTESMSTVPYTLDALRWGSRLNHVETSDALWDGVTRLGIGPAMGITAENLADLHKISRDEQDELAYSSHMRASRAIEDGKFRQETLQIEIPQKKGEPKVVTTDEGPRPDTTVEKLAKLRPIFKKDGTVTAGNASSMNDASAGMLIMTLGKAEKLGLKPIARILSYAVAGVDPDIMGISPVPAGRKALEKAGLKLSQMDLVEINEAFAAQYLAVEKEFGLDRTITNVNGSGISLGHPIGATGARISVSLLYELKRRQAKRGLAALCGGGGVGMAMVFEIL